MITNRRVSASGFGGDLAAQVSYWVAPEGADVTSFASWSPVGLDAFRSALVAIANAFPAAPADGTNEGQQHVSLLIHGYNNSWDDAARWYQQLANTMFQPGTGLGAPVRFTWPSKGSPAEYLPDRRGAEDSARDLADVLSELYDWMVGVQAAAARNPAMACRAKTSIIAHSMGN
jgi:esterase/lipase superfamily enzyme